MGHQGLIRLFGSQNLDAKAEYDND